MNYAIGISLFSNEGDFDPEASHFFGDPLIPEGWVDDFDEDTIFFCQIRLADIEAYDNDHILPHDGYLYVFLDTANGKYAYRPIVRYYNGQPNVVLDEFNEAVEGYEQFSKPLSCTFSTIEPDAYAMKLLGIPSDWNYADEPPQLLMEIDHLDDTLCFHDEIDGVSYLFFGKDHTTFRDVTMHCEHS